MRKAATARSKTKHLSPARRSVAALEAFEAKVSLLQAWAKEGPPEGQAIPRTHTALRSWRGPDGTFGVWSDPKIDRCKTGKYPKLAADFEAAIAGIDAWLAGRTGELGKLRMKVTVLEAENRRLLLQNAELISRNVRLEQDGRTSRALDRARTPAR